MARFFSHEDAKDTKVFGRRAFSRAEQRALKVELSVFSARGAVSHNPGGGYSRASAAPPWVASGRHCGLKGHLKKTSGATRIATSLVSDFMLVFDVQPRKALHTSSGQRPTCFVQNATSDWNHGTTEHTERHGSVSVCLVYSVVKQSIPIAIPIPIWMKP